MNDAIRVPQVRLIGHDGTALGIKPIKEAILLAQDHGFDLVEIAPNGNPPVCRILDFSKYRYEKEKQKKESRKHQKGGHVKEVRFRPRIGVHDWDTKVRAIEKFLKNRDKVRISIVFRGRENEHRDLGRNLLTKLQTQVEEMGTAESPPSQMGNRMILMLAPKR